MYDQMNGAAMASPVAPILTNTSMEYCKKDVEFRLQL